VAELADALRSGVVRLLSCGFKSTSALIPLFLEQNMQLGEDFILKLVLQPQLA